MTLRLWTALILMITAAVLAGWECITFATPTDSDSISAVVRSANRASGGLVALGIGALWVHWFLIEMLPRGWR